jgi:hypothetical protein
METLQSICNLGVRNVVGECSYQVFRMRNGDWADAEYPIGSTFEIIDSSYGNGYVALDEDGDKVWIPQSEMQCFNEIEME